MKRIWFWAIPVFICVFVAFGGCGCKQTIIRFYSENLDSENKLNLVINSLNNETAIAKLVSNVDLDKISLTYEKSIIDYDISTGVVKAKKEGQTTLKAQADNVEASIDVNVAKNYFCGSTFKTNSATNFVIRNMEDGLDIEPFNLVKALKQKFSSLEKYNMGYKFKAVQINGKDVLDVDENTGVVTPKAEGEENIEITVVSGIENGEQIYRTETIKVTVKKPCSQLNFAIYEVTTNNNIAEVDYTQDDDVKVYYLDNSKWYVSRYTADADLKNESNNFGMNDQFYDFSSNDLAENNCISKISSGDSVYSPLLDYYKYENGEWESVTQFYPKRDFIWQKEYVDYARNCLQTIKSNRIKIVVSQPFVVDDDMLSSAVAHTDDGDIFISDENFSFDVDLNITNLDDLTVVCEPEDCCSYNDDYKTTHKLTFTLNDGYTAQNCRVSVKNGEDTVFSYGFMVLPNWDGKYLTLVEAISPLSLSDGFLYFELEEKYASEIEYDMFVFDEDENLIEEELFDCEINYNLASNNMIGVSLSLKTGVNYNQNYKIKFQANNGKADLLCSDFIDLVIENQGGTNG